MPLADDGYSWAVDYIEAESVFLVGVALRLAGGVHELSEATGISPVYVRAYSSGLVQMSDKDLAAMLGYVNREALQAVGFARETDGVSGKPLRR